MPEHPLVHIGSAALGARFRPLGDEVRPARPWSARFRCTWVTAWSCVTPAAGPCGAPWCSTRRLRRSGAAVRPGGARRRWPARPGRPTWPTSCAAAASCGFPSWPGSGSRSTRRTSSRWRSARETGCSPASRCRVCERELSALVDERRRSTPLDAALPLGLAATRLGLPTPELVAALVESAARGGRGPGRRLARHPSDALLEAIGRLEEQLAEAPFAAPDSERLAQLGLDRTGLAAAEKAGRLLRVGDGVVLLPGADRQAAAALADLPQPFTTSQARVRLGTSRRVVLPLLALLDAQRLTRRLPDDRREVLQAPRALDPALGHPGADARGTRAGDRGLKPRRSGYGQWDDSPESEEPTVSRPASVVVPEPARRCP